MNYANTAFTEVIKAIQEQQGSRDIYERMEKQSYRDGLTEVEKGFISGMDSFYLASFGENGFPYIQHRGGPKGFVKVIDKETLGMIDFSGNKQYISVGNIVTNNKVSLIMMSYPMRARLKIYAKAEVIEIEDDPALFKELKPNDYKFKPERMLIFRIEAYDWNCPQHIIPRYTESEITEILGPKLEYIEKLEEELSTLRNRIKG
ncbi:pyridoxamine 5'-phosphate oxidase family protein [Chryseobacterium sp. PTM-20240506]|uniref:pyridoxamine 5'-phosphate oxidase family protein n=1 Tax=unclassified Chryseobacterium TaxID=2593645 RepID=UPI0023599630|nr:MULTISPECIES: pyridoxamine 5'-phosphate oxidase family protein [unclassified Chryseobacterium]MDC8103393.1 pyridoxamine 5'-phosphate oxidase family protein [Chryseobacterium sp. B21-037]MDQ1802950.1 pyridoxamine 5'-phosphate oxidase family protein [Chryseobacterium sp. CKR4-1]